MKFSLIHPSRGRPMQAFETAKKWLHKSSYKHEIEYIVSVDLSDPNHQMYFDNFTAVGLKVLVSDNRSIVDAVNIAAKQTTGDCLIVVSDDFDCPEHWDESLAKEISKYKGPDYAILVNDGNQHEIMTIPILSRELYTKLGYVYYPEYFSMHADNDITYICNHMKALYKSNLVFEHHHYTVGKASKDDTYSRQNSKTAWQIGEKLFNRRMKEITGT